VVILSPESYHDANKLRPALLSPALEDHSHITVFDEAHCVHTWGGDFCKAYVRCGELRVFMLHPPKCSIIAATANASPPVKKSVKASLQMRKGYHLENLGNFRNNMLHDIHHMPGGQKSYHEVCKLLPLNIDDVEQTVIVVNDYHSPYGTAAATRKHFGISGKAARTLAPVYHTLMGERSKRCIERLV
jgi:superfamily II DNA helicase RecQ